MVEELWNAHTKPFFPFSSAATCTNRPLEVDQRVRRDLRIFHETPPISFTKLTAIPETGEEAAMPPTPAPTQLAE
ncbi:hypothetical protein Taro_013865, partial [Colocasia esculenta]|nr:hypothetical protein [Colocasia esculenta]